MGDEDDADAPRLQAPHGHEQLLHLACVEAGGRLVENQDARGKVDGAGDGDDLLHRHREGGQAAPHVDIDAEATHDLGGPPPRGAEADEAEAAGLAPDEQVFGYRHVRQEVDLLIDGADAGLQRVGGTFGMDLAAGDADGAAVARQHAGHGLDEGRFAGPVLAEQGMDLAGAKLEIDAVQRPDAAEGLAQPLDREDGRPLGRRLPRRRRCVHEDTTRGMHSRMLASVRPGRARSRPVGVPTGLG